VSRPISAWSPSLATTLRIGFNDCSRERVVFLASTASYRIQTSITRSASISATRATVSVNHGSKSRKLLCHSIDFECGSQFSDRFRRHARDLPDRSGIDHCLGSSLQHLQTIKRIQHGASSHQNTIIFQNGNRLIT